jgi:hypothetical protein
MADESTETPGTTAYQQPAATGKSKGKGARGASKLEQSAPAADDQELSKAEELGVDVAAARGLGQTAGGPAYVPQEGDRTAVEKVEALAEVAGSGEEGSQNLTLAEIAAKTSNIEVVVTKIADLLARSFNVDFLNEASVSDVLSGEAAARGSLAPFGEHPHLVDDAVIPPGMNNPTGEILPPNLPAGSEQQDDGTWQVPDEAKALVDPEAKKQADQERAEREQGGQKQLAPSYS